MYEKFLCLYDQSIWLFVREVICHRVVQSIFLPGKAKKTLRKFVLIGVSITFKEELNWNRLCITLRRNLTVLDSLCQSSQDEEVHCVGYYCCFALKCSLFCSWACTVNEKILSFLLSVTYPFVLLVRLSMFGKWRRLHWRGQLNSTWNTPFMVIPGTSPA